MFHVKPLYFFFRPRTNAAYTMDRQVVFSEKGAQIEDKRAALESLDITGFSEPKTLKNGLFRSFSMKWKLFGTLLLLNSICFGQLEPVAIGQWKIHMPLNNAKDVAHSGSKYYAAFTNGLLVYDAEDGSTEQLSKTNGLTTIGLKQVELDPVTNQIVVGYADGNIDLISTEGEIYNLGDIERSNIIGDKSIYSLSAFNGFVYVCTGFGIVVLDVERKEFKDTYVFGPGGSNIKVNSVCTDGTKIYAATDDGLYFANLNDPFLANYTSWSKDTSLNPAAVNGPFSDVAYHAGSLYLSREITGFLNDSAYVFNGTSWGYFTQALGNDVNKIKTSGNRLIVVGNGIISHYDNSMALIQDAFNYTFDYIDAEDCDFDPVSTFMYISDRRHGLVRGLNSWYSEKISPESPYNTGAAHISAGNGNLWIAHDGFAGVNGINLFLKGFFSGVYDGKWRNYNSFTEPLMPADSVFDAVSVVVDPKDENHVFAGTYSYKGIYEFQDGEIIAVWDESNSAIENVGGSGYNAIAAMEFDEDGNLWAINSKSLEPLVVKMKDGSWFRFDLGSNMKNRNLYDVEAGKNGYVWVAAPTGNSVGGLMVFNPNGTIDDDSDDEQYYYGSGAGFGNLPSKDVKCVAEDLDEEMWIGTANGVAVVYSQEAIFNGGNPDAQQILIEQDGNVQILFENEVITDIEVDGANRKWIATEGSGAFLMSEDGQEQILYLSEENSPLLSDIVNDIAIDHSTGDVYFATSEGIVSLRYTAVGSGNAYLDVYAFPNPVSENYEGIIAVKGLSRDSDFKVTDISGNIVYHGISTGGQAIWDLKDIKGNRVSSGVYLIYCNSESGAKDAVAKLLVIN